MTSVRHENIPFKLLVGSSSDHPIEAIALACGAFQKKNESKILLPKMSHTFLTQDLKIQINWDLIWKPPF